MEYSWTKEYITSQTHFQIRRYIKVIAERKFCERRLNLFLQRAAQHGDKIGCEQFLESIKPKDMKETSSDSRDMRDMSSLPMGIVYIQE